jgi:hypothetical protein
MRRRQPRGVTISPEARQVLEAYDVHASELVEAWMQETDEMVVLTRGERAVVLVYEDRGLLQLVMPAELRRTTGHDH